MTVKVVGHMSCKQTAFIGDIIRIGENYKIDGSSQYTHTVGIKATSASPSYVSMVS